MTGNEDDRRRVATGEFPVEFQTAPELGTSEITIKVHRGQIMRRMGAQSLSELVRMAEKLGVL